MTRETSRVIIDGNEAAASVAYPLSEVCLVYPISPATPMAEYVDLWANRGVPNLWGNVPLVEQMQGAGGVAGALHGALRAGALATTFTASQALVRMMPNLFRIAGELTPAVIHVATRAVPGQGTTPFGDHSDVMAVRQTGVGMLASASVQEVHDMALVAHVATLESSIPFIHFFDGLRTSHEVHDIERLDVEVMRDLLSASAVAAHRKRALDPRFPTTRGTAQNHDVFFQAREAANPYYDACPDILQQVMDRFAQRTGRAYRLFEYSGHPDAERVLILMGSAAETARETVDGLARSGERVGMVKVRLYRPFDAERLLAELPASTKTLAVLDRTKEPGAPGEPLFLDVVSAVAGAEGLSAPAVRGGRYGLGGKPFTPGMVLAVLHELAAPSIRGAFTVGIHDDLTHRSLVVGREPTILPGETTQAVFYGLGSDGTVSANINSIRIIGEETGYHVQAYFLHDARRAASATISHLRFGPRPICAPYLVEGADFIGCHHFPFVHRLDVLRRAAPGATFLLNSPYPPRETWEHLPQGMRDTIIRLGLRTFVIDACGLARERKLGSRINTIMQACFFALTEILPCHTAMDQIKSAIGRSYKKRGQVVVERNRQAVDRALEALVELRVPTHPGAPAEPDRVIPDGAPPFVTSVTAQLLSLHGDALPVSALPPDGTWPPGTSAYEKRRISQWVPVWNPRSCLQCGLCSLLCPHGCIRAVHYDAARLADAPEAFPSAGLRGRGLGGRRYTLQIHEEDCTGCGVCTEACPTRDRERGGARSLVFMEAAPRRELHREHLRFFSSLPVVDRPTTQVGTVRGLQFVPPLFEFPGACAGCGETPYLKLLTQLFGDRLLVSNAAGCSAAFGGNLPTSPWTTGATGKGPAWSSSLYVDTAEFGYGFRLALDVRQDPESNHSVWIVGGDGWAHDSGFGGLDHVLASGRDLNILVLDTEICSSCGGQVTKSTPCGVVGKFAARGKESRKRDLGRVALGYAGVYVAQIALGANPQQAVRAFREAEAHEGPSLILAYCPCVAHGFNLQHGPRHQAMAVHSGHWPLFRYHPGLPEAPRLILDCLRPCLPFKKFAYSEVRYNLLPRADPERSKMILARCEQDVAERWAFLETLATPPVSPPSSRKE